MKGSFDHEGGVEKEQEMEKGKNWGARTLRVIAVAVLAAAVAVAAASCGSGATSASSAKTSEKLPPEATAFGSSNASFSTSPSGESAEDSAVTSSTGTGSQGSAETSSNSGASQATTGITKTAYLSGVNFSVVSVSREDSNSTVAGGNAREVAGDFLYIELTATNVSDGLVDLSDFSFRLWNPAIEAGLYEDYYGNDGTYGGYVSTNMISAALLDLETLQSVSYKLRIGETAEDIFLFFDLNPLSTAKNEGVTLDATNLVIYDTESGEKAEINLSGFTG